MSVTTCPLSIIIVSWNTRDLLARCLDSLAAPGGMPESAEVVVVDNASTDGSVAYLRARYPWVHVIECAINSGFAAGTNCGLAVARGAHLLLLNSDTEVRPGALVSMMTYLQQHAGAGAVGADIRNSDGSMQPCAGPAPSLLSETCGILGFDRTFRSLTEPWRRKLPSGRYLVRDWVLGAALMVPRAVYEAVGPLDAGYFMYSEEIDWCTRIRASGWQVGTLVGAQVLHHGGGSTRRTSDRMRPALFRSKIRYLSLHRGEQSARLFRVVVRVVAGLHVIRAQFPGWHKQEEAVSWRAVRQSI
jgi:N-acetylglucosaminyl-diphospho-decaprenol L-rhamnosyltransferase